MIGSDLRHIFYRSLSGSGGGNSGRAIRAAYIGLGNNQKAKVWGDKYMEQYNAPASTVVSGYQLYTTKSNQTGLTVDDVIPSNGTTITYSNPSFSVLTKNTVILYEDPRGGAIKEETDVPDNPYKGNAFASADGKWKFYLDGNTNGIQTAFTNNQPSITFPAAPSNSPSGIIAHTNIYALPKNMNDVTEFRNLPDMVNVGNGNAVYYQATNPFAIWGKNILYNAGLGENPFEYVSNRNYRWNSIGVGACFTMKALTDCNIAMSCSTGTYIAIRIHGTGLDRIEDVAGEVNNNIDGKTTGIYRDGEYGSYVWKTFNDATTQKSFNLFPGDYLCIYKLTGSAGPVYFNINVPTNNLGFRIVDDNGIDTLIDNNVTALKGLVELRDGGKPTSFTINNSAIALSGYKIDKTIDQDGIERTIKCTSSKNNTYTATITPPSNYKFNVIASGAKTAAGSSQNYSTVNTVGQCSTIATQLRVGGYPPAGSYTYITFTPLQNCTVNISTNYQTANGVKCYLKTGTGPITNYDDLDIPADYLNSGTMTLTKDTTYTCGIITSSSYNGGSGNITITVQS